MGKRKLWVGLDLGLYQTHICVVDSLGRTVHEQACDAGMSPLQEALSGFPASQIGLIAVEAGTEVHIVRKLRATGLPVAIFESRKASRFLAMRRNKTDSGDAKGLADLARVGRATVSQVYLKSLECQQLRSQLVMRKRLVQMRVATEGAIRSRLALFGTRFKTSMAPGGNRDRVEKLIQRIQAEEGIDLRPDLAPLVDVCESLRAYLRKLDADLEALAKAHPICCLLMGVPGVGPICALSFFSAVEDPSRFDRAADVAAYLGLVPRRYQSGEVSRTYGITKTGSKLTRTHLVTAAMVFGSRAPECALKQWFVALRERAGGKRARVALARKLAIVLLTMWKNKSEFQAVPLIESQVSRTS